jgi:hypothetical protein
MSAIALWKIGVLAVRGRLRGHCLGSQQHLKIFKEA